MLLNDSCCMWSHGSQATSTPLSPLSSKFLIAPQTYAREAFPTSVDGGSVLPVAQGQSLAHPLLQGILVVCPRIQSGFETLHTSPAVILVQLLSMLTWQVHLQGPPGSSLVSTFVPIDWSLSTTARVIHLQHNLDHAALLAHNLVIVPHFKRETNILMVAPRPYGIGPLKISHLFSSVLLLAYSAPAILVLLFLE